MGPKKKAAGGPTEVPPPKPAPRKKVGYWTEWKTTVINSSQAAEAGKDAPAERKRTKTKALPVEIEDEEPGADDVYIFKVR